MAGINTNMDLVDLLDIVDLHLTRTGGPGVSQSLAQGHPPYTEGLTTKFVDLFSRT